MSIENQDNLIDRDAKIREGHELFQELLDDPERLKSLVEGSYFFVEDSTPEETYESWEKHRKSVAEAIDRDGTILDFGCANGFLLRCLQEWSGRDLDVWGIDEDKEKLDEAKELFPGEESHFLSNDEIVKDRNLLPPEFDYVYWNIWDKYIEDGRIVQSKYFGRLFELVKKDGKFMLGLYHEDPEQNQKIINELEIAKLTIEEIIDSQEGPVFVVLNKS